MWIAVVTGVVVVLVLSVVLLVRAVRGASGARGSTPDAVEQVHGLAQLRDAGAITTEEYEARKNRVLGPI